MDKDSNQEGKDKDQDNEEESDPLHANNIEEYYGKRVFIFLHHFAGPNDPLSAEIQKEATAAGIKVKCISVEKSSGTGDLLQDDPYNTHLGWAHNGYIDAYHSGFPCTTFSKLRFRPAEGLTGPVRTMDEPYGKKDNTAAEQEECDRGTVMACRSIDMARAVAERKGEARIKASATLEKPPPSSQEGHLSAWELPELGAF